MDAITELELLWRMERARRRQMDTGYRARTPGYSEYASGALGDVATVETLSNTGFPIVSDAADAALATDAARRGKWGEAALYGTALALPFVSGPVLKKGFDVIGRKLGPVGDVPYDPNIANLVELEAYRQAMPGRGEVEAPYGIRRHKPYYHGTATEGAREGILDRGFAKGESAELKLPGTSLSEDPTVSAGAFARDDLSNVLRVDVDVPPERVRNLSPEEYLGGVNPEPGSVYRKPNLFYKESETFGVRDTLPLSPESRKPLEQERDALQRQMADLGRSRSVGNEWRNSYKTLDQRIKEINYQLYVGKEVPPPFRARTMTEREQQAVLRERLLQDELTDRSRPFRDTFFFDRPPQERARMTREFIGSVMAVQGNRGAALDALNFLDPTSPSGTRFWTSFAEMAGREEHDRLGRMYMRYKHAAEKAKSLQDSEHYRKAMRAKDELLQGLRPYAGVRPPIEGAPSIPGPRPPRRGERAQ